MCLSRTDTGSTIFASVVLVLVWSAPVSREVDLPIDGTGLLRFTAELVCQRVDDFPDDRDKTVDAGLVVFAPARVQARQRDVVGGVIVSLPDEGRNPLAFRLDFQACLGQVDLDRHRATEGMADR